MVDTPIFHKPADGAGAEKVAASMGMPTRWEISTIGRMSASTVRAAQFGLMRMRWLTISRANASASLAARVRRRETDIDGIDGQGFHQVKDFDFVVDGWDRGWTDSAGRRARFRH